MSLSCITVGATPSTVNQGAHTVLYQLNGEYHLSQQPPEVFVDFEYGLNGALNNNIGGFSVMNDFDRAFTSWEASPINSKPVLACDKLHTFRATAFDSSFGTKRGNTVGFKSYAVTGTTSAPTSTAILANSATISCNFVPNTDESVATARMQYRVLGSTTWIDAPGGTTDYSGYAQVNISRNITGLNGLTTYEVRLYAVRNTSNETIIDSSILTIYTFATPPEVPSIATVAATSISNTSATLNCTANPNSIACRVRFGYGVADAGAGTWANYTAYQNVTGGPGGQALNVGVTGLLASTPYFFRALLEYPSPGFATTIQGASLSFTTTVDPNVLAKDAEMLPIQDFDRKYGVATTIFFVVPSPAATSSNLFYTGGAVWAGAGESKISKITGGDVPVASAFADTTNDPVQVGTQLYSLALTAAEMQCDQSFVVLNDTGAAVRDVLLRIRTHQQLGTVDIDAATGQKANATAFKATGYQAGHGIQGIAGATGRDISGIIAQHFIRTGTALAGGASTIDLDAGASGTDNFYNDNVIMIVGGLGAGQARAIISYTNANKRCTVDSSWVTNPDSTSVFLILASDRTWRMYRTELSAMPADNASYGDKLQLITQRFSFKITQTATVQTLFKADNASTLATRSVSDAAGTQTVGKLS